ncbi:chromosome-associated kinesin KIF4A-like [Octopus vulgaris]|nr:chromosome-associated kinesin KIF4A-like [Octopus vulgaris]
MAIPVKVAVRCRPLNNKETDEGGQTCVDFPSEGSCICLRKKIFGFNFVFSPEISQIILYEEAVKPLINNLFLGYNATVLAYGQTGSGKTYTMGGAYTDDMPEETRGIIPRVLIDIFAEFKTRDMKVSAGVSYLEIYKEEIHDLLSEQKDQLCIREDYSGDIMIPGLTEVSVSDFTSTMACLTKGSTVRSTGSTAMNAQSSRSHAIFTITFTITSKTDTVDVRKAKFHLVDLAGSERIKKTMAEGDRLKEGININKGLLSLGNVISALSLEGGKRGHVPYRDSKLTRILQDSLGGNSYTLMIACISPADVNLEESVNTLRYAERASHIKNKPLINRDKRAAEIQELKQCVETLKAELIRVTGSGSDHEDYQSIVEKLELKAKENSILSEELKLAIDRETDLLNKVLDTEASRDTFQECLTSILSHLKDFLEDESVKEELVEAYTSVKEKIDKADSSLENVEDRSLEQQDGDIDNTSLTQEHVMQQAALGKELKEINEVLYKKMNLVQQMNKSEENIVMLKHQYQASMDKLQSEIENLQKERDMLKTELDTKSKAGTISEKRRQKMKSLEQEIDRLKLKMSEFARLQKLKENADKKIKTLDQDIQILKTNRVNLIKKMKKESDVYRSWKMKKDVEVNKLLQNDRKRQFEIQKLQRAQEKQQAILKRKSEEAAVANKRLKEALKKQALVRNDRNNNFERYDASANATKLKTLLEQELEVKVRVKEAKYHLKNLVEDRKTLSLELRRLKNSDPPTKKHITTDGDGSPKEVNISIKKLTDEINDRNVQIATLQSEIQEAENDKFKGCVETIRSINDSKVLLNFLIEKSIKERIDHNNDKSAVKDLKNNYLEAVKEKDSSEMKAKSLQNQHESSLVDLQQKYESKISFLLKQLKNGSEEEDSPVPKGVHAARNTIFVPDTPDILDNDPDYHPDSSMEFDTPYMKVTKKQAKPLKSCRCLRSKCKSKVCPCFKKTAFCLPSCSCANCENKPTFLFDSSTSDVDNENEDDENEDN